MTDDDHPECENCGEARTPGSPLCPPCEDARRRRPDPVRLAPARPAQPAPPHGNTTR